MKNLFVIFILSLLFNELYSQVDTVFYDGFNDTRPTWKKDTEENAARVEGGNYIWQRKQAGEWSTWWTVEGINPEEFIIETKFKIEGNGSFGLNWGLKDVDNANYFLVNYNATAKSYIESRNNLDKILLVEAPCTPYRPEITPANIFVELGGTIASERSG